MNILKGVTFLVIGIILLLAFLVMQPFLGIIVTGTVFAIFLNPLYRKLYKNTGKNALSGFLTVLFAFIFIIIPLGVLLWNLLSEIISIMRQVQQNPEWITSLQPTLEGWLGESKIYFDLDSINFNNQVSQALSFLARNIGGIALQLGAMMLNLFFILLTLYFLLVNHQKIIKYISDLSLFPHKYYDLLTARTVQIVNDTLRGYLIVVLLQSLVGTVGFLIFGIPAAFLLGSLYGLSSLVPVVGGFLLWMPAALWLLALGNPASAILLSLWFFCLGFLVDNLIAPRIIGQSTKLHQLLVMFSVFGGIQQFGIMGMVLGPVIMALVFIALEIIKELSDES